MAVFTIKQNDTRPVYTGNIEIGGVGVNLTNCTLTFKMVDDSGALLVNATAEAYGDQVTSPGQFSYNWTAADTAQAGRMFAEVEVLFPDGKIQTFPTVGYERVIIRGDLDSGVTA